MKTIAHLFVAAATALAVAACTDQTDPTIGSESHFLGQCETSEQCGSGLSCECGICTAGCTDDEICSALGDSVCALPSELGAQCSSTVGGTGAICVDRDEASTAWQDLSGPPAAMALYLGQIGERRYFRVGYQSDFDPIYAYYVPGQGWSEATAMTEALAGRPSCSTCRSDRIVGVQGNPYVLTNTTDSPGDYILYGSPDGGETWEPRSLPVSFERVGVFGSDGQHLYIYGRNSGEERKSLWQSASGGRSWVELRSDLERPGPVGANPSFLLVWSGSGHGEVSLDAGQTWRTLGADCESLGGYGWFEHESRYFSFGGSGINQVSPDGGCRSMGGIDRADGGSPMDIRAVDGRVFAVLSAPGANFGQIVLDPLQWQPKELPDGVFTHGYQGAPQIVDLGEDGVGLWTSAGFLSSTDGGDNWKVNSHTLSYPGWFVELDGQIFARTFAGYFKKPVVGGAWRRINLGPRDLILRDGMPFVVQRNRPVIYRPTDDLTAVEPVWEEPAEILNGQFDILPADLHFHGERVFVRSAGDAILLHPPGSQVEGAETSGGGIFFADSLTDEFQPFGDGLPAESSTGSASIHSMAFHDGFIWVVTSRSGVWRADLEQGQWVSAHAGLPTIDDAETSGPAEQLVVIQDRLFAFGDGAVWSREDDSWRKITAENFIDVSATDGGRDEIVGLVEFQDQLFVAATDGLYTLDADSGEHEVFWRPDEKTILMARSLPSGLYVGLSSGGLHRLESLD